MATDSARGQWWRGRLGGVVLALVAMLGLLALPPLIATDHAIAPASSVRLPMLAPADSARRFAVYVADYGYHTSIFVEQPRDWPLEHADAEPDSGGAYAEYAWGDRRFFMESRYAPWSVFATLFLPTEAVAYVAHHARAPGELRGLRALHRRDVSAAEMMALSTQLERWIVRDSAGARSRAFDKVPEYRGRFHRAFGRYSWWQNCNRWTLAQLAVIDASRERALIVMPSHVLSQLKGFAIVAMNDPVSVTTSATSPRTVNAHSGNAP